jgi:hypothetical protein
MNQISTTPREIPGSAQHPPPGSGTSNLLDTVKEAQSAGLCIIPPRQDGSKAPGVPSWRRYQYERPTDDDLDTWYRELHYTGIGSVTGAVSRMECFEFDDRETYERFKDAARRVGYGELVDRIEEGWSDETPSRGVHWHYRCSDISRNTVLARHPHAGSTTNGKVLIETRGEGGFVIMAPSSGTVHPSGLPYKRLSGGPSTIAPITPEERSALFAFARTFDEMPVSKVTAPAPPTVRGDDTRPGDDFNERATWPEILEPHGWELIYEQEGMGYWRRFGKTDGISATTNWDNTDCLRVFTSSTVLEPKMYQKFTAYAVLNHSGDWSAAARELGKLGYGSTESPPTRPVNDAAIVPVTEPVTGHEVLAEVETFLSRFVSYPSENARIAHTLWIAHAHLMDAWESTPRLAALSPEPASGKTRLLEITELLVPNPVEAVNVTPAYLFRKVGHEDGRPTILYDEIDTVFGPKAKDNEEIRGLLNAGHRVGAVAGRCVVRGKVVETEEIPAYCAVALAGLGEIPDTILSRSIVIPMRRRSSNERVEGYRRRVHTPEGRALRNRLAAWTQSIRASVSDAWPEMPTGVEDRSADIWEPLLAVADAAGGDWPTRARVAAVALVADARAGTPSMGIKLLSDIRTLYGLTNIMSTDEILQGLHALPEAPWGDWKGKPLDARGLARMLGKYNVKSKTIRIGTSTPKGYAREDFEDAWSRYLGPPHSESATSATSETAPTPISPEPVTLAGMDTEWRVEI